jgi:tetratricopeptide (TPR) repeat protein
MMADTFDYDVFISYSSRDKAWVRGELLERIEKAGLRACIDFRDFKRGALSISEMERGVLKCRKTLAVLTPSYVQSDWAEIENIMVQTLDPANRNLRLIPILKLECEKPLRIGALTHIDFTDGADLDLAWRQLLTALGKPPDPVPPKEPQSHEWFLAHPYPMPPNFTGRLAEREVLDRWLEADAAHPLLVVRALGGFGKSALVWHWLMNDVNPRKWPRVAWWSFYEGDASFDRFLADTLQYLSGGTLDAQKLSGKDAVSALLQSLVPPGTLLVLDGFERVLRAFGGLDAAYQGDDALLQGQSAGSEGYDTDCISPLAEFFLHNVALQLNRRSRVILTTRLCPRVLEAKGGGLLQGCREEELRQMQPADAVEFFRSLAIRGTRSEIEAACAPYGYHPLSLRLLAGLIVRDLQQPGDIAAATRLDVSGDLVQRQHHVLEAAYDSLGPDRQTLLGRIACFRSPVRYEALKALAITQHPAEAQHRQRKKKASAAPGVDASAVELDSDLRDLVARALLHHDTKEGRFDLHPIVRRYAYDRLAAPDRAAAHSRLRDYFAAVPNPDKVGCVEDLAPVVELYHHTVRAGQFDAALRLFRDRLWFPLFYQLGAYQLIIDLLRALFPDGEDRLARLKDRGDQRWTLGSLASSYGKSGQHRRAVPLRQQEIAICEEQGQEGKLNLATGLSNMSQQQIPVGALRVAESNIRRSIALCDELEEEFQEAVGHFGLGRLLAYRGAYAESATELAKALNTWEKQTHVQGQCMAWCYRALQRLLRRRSSPRSASLSPQSVIAPARRALELADENAHIRVPVERDYAYTHWLLGAGHRVAGQLDEAEHHLHEALGLCRRSGLVELEGDILIDVARLRVATGTPEEAQRLTEEALVITERSGYVLQGADAHLELANLALARGDRSTARVHATEARRLATCDGPPDYTYKAAYDEAGALLKQLK